MANKVQYLIRLDDACPTMNSDNWSRIESILDKYSIQPMVGIIPDNDDLSLRFESKDLYFWDRAISWQKKSWTIALHGHNHVYLTNEGGMNPVHNRSEFAGLSLKQQEEKIENGLAIFAQKKIYPSYFFAPSHTFDGNTLTALRNKSQIRRISDTISRKVYKSDGFIFYPLQFGRFRQVNVAGQWTFCFHPNNMNEQDFLDFELFINENLKRFISFDSIETDNLYRKSMLDSAMSSMYFLRRKLYKYSKK